MKGGDWYASLYFGRSAMIVGMVAAWNFLHKTQFGFMECSVERSLKTPNVAVPLTVSNRCPDDGSLNEYAAETF